MGENVDKFNNGLIHSPHIPHIPISRCFSYNSMIFQNAIYIEEVILKMSKCFRVNGIVYEFDYSI